MWLRLADVYRTPQGVESLKDNRNDDEGSGVYWTVIVPTIDG